MISRRGPHKLRTSENIIYNEQNRMAEENIDKRVKILENKKLIHVHVIANGRLKQDLVPGWGGGGGGVL